MRSPLPCLLAACLLLLAALCLASPVLAADHCQNCMSGMPMEECPHPEWCVGVDCSPAANCQDGIATETCPDPGTCDFEPIPCVGCTPGQFRHMCPHPEWCANNQTTYPCIDCMEGHEMPGCPNAQACIGPGPMPPPPSEDSLCEGCMDGMPMPGCPKPQACGFKPFLCVDCMDSHPTKCPHPEWCAGVDCGHSAKCQDGVRTDSCPDPGTCGFKPIPCVGCTPGQFRHMCPHPEWCANNQTTYPCIDCMAGHAMPDCPNAQACIGPGPMPPAPPAEPLCEGCVDAKATTGCPKPQACGFKPIMCVDCMDHFMPKCPFPEMCKGVDCESAQCENGVPTESCPDPGTCGFQPISCVGCTPGQFRNACPHPEWCANNQTTYPCIDCMDGHPMPGCPDKNACIGPGPMPAPWDPNPEPMCEGCMEGMYMPGCPDPSACPAGCTMNMYFGVSADVCVLLKDWHVTNNGQWAGVFFFVLLLALLRECLSVYRVHRVYTHKMDDSLRRMYNRDPAAAAKLGIVLSRRNSNSIGNSGSLAMASASAGSAAELPDTYHAMNRSSSPRPLSQPQSVALQQAIDSTYYTLSLSLGYLLMLLIMTYNVWLCVIVVLGCGAMHFLCNYVYLTSVRRKTLSCVRAQVTQFQEQSRLMGGAGAAAGVPGMEGRPMPPTGGDHCCDEINFDDI